MSEGPKLCGKCGQPISGQVLSADGCTFHFECFTCDKCDRRINGGFQKQDGKRLCLDCVPKVLCEACSKPCEGQVTKVGNKSWHPDCFKCQTCSACLGTGFFSVGGKIVCKACAEGAQVKTRKTCRKCGKPIDGKCIIADRGDTFHEECFVCASCGKSLEDYVLDEKRRFKFQEYHYLCKSCSTSEEAAETCMAKKCLVCQEPCKEGEDILHLADGYCLHWRCFKCSGCGKAEKPCGDTQQMTLLRSRVQAVRRGEYLCDRCNEDRMPEVQPRLDLKVTTRLAYGTYLGKGPAADGGGQIMYSVRLMEGGKCWLDLTKHTKIDSESWHVEGDYTEDLNAEDGRVKAIHFEVTNRPYSVGPKVGEVYDMDVGYDDREESQPVVTCCGVKCPWQLGVPDVELAQMMAARPKQAAPLAVPPPKPAAEAEGAGDGILDDGVVPSFNKGGHGHMERTKVDVMSHNIIKDDPRKVEAPAAAIPAAVPDGCFSLEDMMNPEVWKANGVDASMREQYLSDDAFAAVFGQSKAEFEKLPKWKRDKQKKDHGLF